jgi:putative PIN family toxin of toxin-antitoxin system
MSDEAECVVFDCVVCTQAILNPDGPAGKCLELARDGGLTLCISDYLLTEIRELPDKLSPRFQVTSPKIEEFVADLKSFAPLIVNIPQIYHLQRDPDDSHYINLALAAGKLITSRDRDLLDLMDDSNAEGRDFLQRFPGLRILTPPALLQHLQQQRDAMH